MNNDIRAFILEASYKCSYLYEKNCSCLDYLCRGKKKTGSGLIQFFFPIFSELICFLCAVSSTLF